jgi:hypothetical protein
MTMRKKEMMTMRKKIFEKKGKRLQTNKQKCRCFVDHFYFPYLVLSTFKFGSWYFDDDEKKETMTMRKKNFEKKNKQKCRCFVNHFYLPYLVLSTSKFGS